MVNNKGECDRLSLAIKVVMKKNRVRHADLAKALKLSVPTMKRTLSKGPLSLERLMAICDALNIGFYELVEIAKESATDSLKWMTDEQEEYLLKNPGVAEYLIHIMNGLTPEEIQKKVGLNAGETKKYLFKLQNQRLISKSTRDTYSICPPVWRGARPGGKLAADFARRCHEVVPQMVRDGLLDTGSSLDLKATTAVGFQLSDKSRRDMHQQLKDVLSRFAAIERKEARSLSPSRLRSLSVILSVKDVSLYAEAYRDCIKTGR